jgi:hypothetical protein
LRFFTLMVGAIGPSAPTPHGSRMETGGGCCRRYQQHPLGGARHRHLQLRWWSLPDLPPAPPGGLPSTSSTSVVPAAEPTASTPQGARHRCFQLLDLQLWHLMDLGWGPVVAAIGDTDNTPQGGPPSTSSTLMVAGVRPAASTPPGGPPSTSSTSGPPAPAPLRAHRERFLALMVDAPGPPAPAPPRGPPSTAE